MKHTNLTETTARPCPPRGDAESFEEDLTNEIPDLRNYALSLTRDPVDAEDLVQDCMLRAIRNQHRFEPGTHLGKWLFTILRNIHFDKCRRRKRRGTHVELKEGYPQMSRKGSQEDWMEVVDLARGLGRLRRCDRDVLMLSAFSKLSQKQIARRLDVAEGTVRSRLSRARATLADQAVASGGAEGVVPN
ncbi:RNA polymerase sigma-70 factor, ECF subfamily [Rhodovulum sp. ES.010]|uniref:RNA polymerase sigma factor n=1 Tax=Rhodovulum sp. ES.010 TaxID=1882821 RepID=UPI0009284B56|nr:RNA polymerase sigma factor [Rhodovulum sp. ES.010]SIO47458.1 RNA polymerase sigma-70 factor, ECF subfamily [Rhodovulum sp. ES.010]